VEFDEEVSFTEETAALFDTATGTYIDLVDADGDTFRVFAQDGSTLDTDDFITAATFVYVDEDGVPVTGSPTAGDRIEITLLEDAEDRNAAGDVTEDAGAVEYKSTITDIENLVDDSAAQVDLKNSDDLIIG